MGAHITDLVIAMLFAVLTVLAWREWRERPTPAAIWLLLTFLTLAIVTSVGLVLPESGGTIVDIVARFNIVLVALFPFFLYRFATSFAPAARWIEHGVRLITAAVVVATILVPDLADSEAQLERGPVLLAYTVLFVAEWAFVLGTVAAKLWLAGRGQARIARSRMRLLAAGAIGMALALLGAAAGVDSPPIEYATSALVVASALAFYGGFAPPRPLRAVWRATSQDDVRSATIALMAADDGIDPLRRFLPHLAALIGASGAAVVRSDGDVIGLWGVTHEMALRAVRNPREEGAETGGEVTVPVSFGTIVVWTSRYMPYFGVEELNIVRSLGVIIELALERQEALATQKAIAERLEKVNQLKNEFVAVVAHDLRSPMSVISGFARTLEMQWDRFDDEQKLSILRMIAENTESLSTLVEDVLQVARIESGELRYDMRPFDMGALVARIARDLAIVDERPIEVQVEARLPTAVGDEDRHWQVVTNLVTNAMKFSAPREPVEIDVRQRERMLEVSVTDHGIGIAREDQPRVFEKFARIIPADHSERVKGTGLGLFICRTIVEAHGGTLSLRSQPGRGSTFSYTLPISEDAS